MYLAAQRDAAGASPVLPSEPREEPSPAAMQRRVVAPIWGGAPPEADVPLYSSPRVSGTELRSIRAELLASRPRRRGR